MDFMIYKYAVSYKNGTKLSGYAIDDDNNKSEREIRNAIAKNFFGDFRLDIEKYGAKYPPINSDYILTIR